MLYDIVMVTLLLASTAGAIWASKQMSKAAKEGKLHVIGIVTRETRMDDSDRIDWLAANRDALKDVYWRLENEDETIRQAIDFFVRVRNERHSSVDQ